VFLRASLLALSLSYSLFAYSDDLRIQDFNTVPQGGLSDNYRTRMNKNTEVFVKNCDNPSPPLSDPEKWCKIPQGWTSNPGDIENGKTATEIWQPTGRCTKGHKFNALTSQCVPTTKEACTWGQSLNSKEKTCESVNTEEARSPLCEIKGFNTEENGSGSWFVNTIPASYKRIFALISCKTKDESAFVPICNLKNMTNNTQTSWYKCAGPDPLDQKSFWVEINIQEISKEEKDAQIQMEVRGAYSKTPLNFHESKFKMFLYKI
jgi:hypothetical protein